jgi:hypothetical protein
MGKKIYKAPNNESKFTYDIGRECRYCHAPIADSEHATREFCPVSIDQSGNVRDCKTSYHRESDKPMRDLISKLIAKHKAISTRINFLIQKHGMEVSTEMLDTYEINLHECIEYALSKERILTSIFLMHTIISNPITNIHKIYYND